MIYMRCLEGVQIKLRAQDIPRCVYTMFCAWHKRYKLLQLDSLQQSND